MVSQPGFFDLDDRYAVLSKAGDPLVRVKEIVPFKAFRYRLEKALSRSDRARTWGSSRCPHHSAAAASLCARVKPDGERLGVPARQQVEPPRLGQLSGDRRSLQRGLGFSHR